MAVFSNGGVTSPDIYIGVSCILAVLICSSLNLLVFNHVVRKKNSLARSLYLALCTADFLTAWVLTGYYSVNVLREKIEECRNSIEPSCNEEYFKRINEARLDQKVHAIVGWIALLAPSNITAILAMSRYYQIRYPLQPPRKRPVICILSFSLVILPVLAGCAMLDVRATDSTVPFVQPITNLAWNFHPRVFGVRTSSLGFFLLMTGVTWALQVGAVSASFLTVYELVKSHLQPTVGGRKNRKTRSSLKILITNVGSVVILVVYAINALKVRGNEDEIGLREVVNYSMVTLIVPSLTSLMNPIVYIILTPKCSFRHMGANPDGKIAKVGGVVQRNEHISAITSC